jgi:glycerol-3-phosphate dehydrogenase (NAD(P)+)
MIWARDPNVVHSINDLNMNIKYMPNVDLSKNLKATLTLNNQLFITHSVILVAIPTQHMRSILETVKGNLSNDHLLIFVSKGIEICSGLLPNDIVKEVLGSQTAKEAVFLSGPSFAAEIVSRLPVRFPFF